MKTNNRYYYKKFLVDLGIKNMLEIIYSVYSTFVVTVVSLYIVAFFIFGGDFKLQINWHSFIDLCNSFKK